MKTVEPNTKHLKILRKFRVCCILKIETLYCRFFFNSVQLPAMKKS